MTRRRNGTLTAAPERTWKCCLVDDGAVRMASGPDGLDPGSAPHGGPPPRSMAVVRVPEFPGWLLLLLLVSIVSGTRRMFVCCCFARWPLPVRPGPLIRPGPSPEARRSVCLVAFQARKPLTQDTSRVPDQIRPVAANGQTARRDMEKWRHGSQAQLERRERAVEWPMPQHVATSLTVMSKSVDWRSRWQKAGCR